LWRKFTSTKEIPVTGFKKGEELGGIMPLRNGLNDKEITTFAMELIEGGMEAADREPIGVIDALEFLIVSRPFLSDNTFLEFNTRSNLQLPVDIAKRLYKRFCDATPRYEGAKNLIAWSDLRRQLSEHILKRTHQLQLTPEGERNEAKFYVGGIWFDPLYNVIITSMPEVPAWEKVKELFDSYVDQHTGLCPLSNVYDIIAKLGRPGLKKEQFFSFVSRLGMKVDEEILLRCFNQVDIEQNNVLDADEMKSGMNLLFEEMVPNLILERNSLMPHQIFVNVTRFLAVLTLMYIFLELSFKTLVGAQGGGKLNAVMQSVLAGGVALLSQNNEEKGHDEATTRTKVSSSLGQFVGAVAHRSIAKDKAKKD
jgi:hypothetical protein